MPKRNKTGSPTDRLRMAKLLRENGGQMSLKELLAVQPPFEDLHLTWRELRRSGLASVPDGWIDSPVLRLNEIADVLD